MSSVFKSQEEGPKSFVNHQLFTDDNREHSPLYTEICSDNQKKMIQRINSNKKKGNGKKVEDIVEEVKKEQIEKIKSLLENKIDPNIKNKQKAPIISKEKEILIKELKKENEKLHIDDEKIDGLISTSYFFKDCDPGDSILKPTIYDLYILAYYMMFPSIINASFRMRELDEKKYLMNDEEAPLHAAARNNAKEIMQLLIDCKGDINIQDINGETPLFKVSNKDTLQWFIEQKADLNKQDCDGDTVLHKASNSWMYYEIVSALINAGADTALLNKQKESVLNKMMITWINCFKKTRTMLDVFRLVDVTKNLQSLIKKSKEPISIKEDTVQIHDTIYDVKSLNKKHKRVNYFYLEMFNEPQDYQNLLHLSSNNQDLGKLLMKKQTLSSLEDNLRNACWCKKEMPFENSEKVQKIVDTHNREQIERRLKEIHNERIIINNELKQMMKCKEQSETKKEILSYIFEQQN